MMLSRLTPLCSFSSFRLLLAGVRLACAYALLCYLVVQGGVQLRNMGETPALATSAQGRQIAAPPGLLGVTVDMEHLLHRAERRAALRRLAEHGVSWVRQRIDWATTEPEPAAFDWRWIDAWLADVEAAGLTPVVVLDGSPAWARRPQDRTPTDNPFAPPADFNDFAHFAGTFAARYADRIRFYQVWDEPNVAPHWGNRHIEPVHYAQLLAKASAAIRATDADAIILTAALAPTGDRGHLAVDEIYFWQRMRSAGATAAFDAVAIQPFGFGFAATHPRQSLSILNYQRAALLHGALVEMGWADKTVWAVRFGWNVRHDSLWGTVSPTNQRAYAADAAAIARTSWPWLVALGWAIDQPDSSAADPMWGFALHDDLLAELSAANADGGSQDVQTSSAPLAAGMTLFLFGFLVWRMGVAASLLPWRDWGSRVKKLSGAQMLLLWSALLVVYYLATWSPIIVLCWACAGFLALHRPHWALWIALLALPFTFQHKEVHLIDVVLTASPMMAAALILTPLLLTRVYSSLVCGGVMHGGEVVCLGAQTSTAVVHPPMEWSPIVDVGHTLLTRVSAWRGWRLAQLHLRSRGGQQAAGMLVIFLLAWLPINLLSAYNVWFWPGYWRGMAELVLAPLVIAGVVIVLLRAGLSSRAVIIALFGGGVLTAAIGLVRWFSGQGVEVDGVLRLTATQFSPNHAALYLERSLFLGVGLVLAARGAERIVWLALTLLVSGALLLTASRGALLLGAPLGIAFVTGVWLWQRRCSLHIIRRSLQLAGLVLGAAVLLSVVTVEAQERLFNIETVASRALLWQAAWQLWQACPIVGVGPGGFFWGYPAYLTSGSSLEANLLHPHNVWLEIATGWGVMGVFWFVGQLAVAFWVLQRAARRSPNDQRWLLVGLAASLVAGLAHSQVDAFLALSDLAGWFFVALGFLAGVHLKDKSLGTP
jgi:O-antigen ligase